MPMESVPEPVERKMRHQAAQKIIAVQNAP